MIIECGKRRLVSDRFGWKIEIQKVFTEKSKNHGQSYWDEDAPAYPATLAQACEMLAERILKESGTTTPNKLVNELRAATHAVHKYMEIARNSA